MLTTLDNLKESNKCRIVDLKTNKKLKIKLMTMGLTKKTVVKLNKIAPLGDPIDIIVRNYHLLIRKNEAKNIIIEKL